jgi:hypothetical protein
MSKVTESNIRDTFKETLFELPDKAEEIVSDGLNIMNQKVSYILDDDHLIFTILDGSYVWIVDASGDSAKKFDEPLTVSKVNLS